MYCSNSIAATVACINRNILECKENFTEQSGGRGSVLIETYWNVKKVALDAVSDHPGINRNILECKVYVPAFSFQL